MNILQSQTLCSNIIYLIFFVFLALVRILIADFLSFNQLIHLFEIL